MAKHYLIAVEEKDEKLFRLFCEKNTKYAMAIGRETTSENLRLDYVLYLVNLISNLVGKSLGMKDWDNLRDYLKRKVKEYCPEKSVLCKLKSKSSIKPPTSSCAS